MRLLQFFIGWTFERYLRLALALAAGVYALISKDYTFLILTAWLGVMAVGNVSCCGSGGCGTSTPSKNSNETNNKEIEVKYKEIK